jgi:carbonic anhydrase
LVKESGASSAIPATFHAFTDLEANVKEQMRRLRSHPWIPESVRIRGFVYDVRTGVLNEIEAT